MDDLQAACQRIGRDFNSIRKSHFFGITTAPDRPALERLIQGIARETGRSVEEVRAGSRRFIGTPEEVVEFLQQYVALGVEQFMLIFPYGHEATSIRLMAERVLPSM